MHNSNIDMSERHDNSEACTPGLNVGAVSKCSQERASSVFEPLSCYRIRQRLDARIRTFETAHGHYIHSQKLRRKARGSMTLGQVGMVWYGMVYLDESIKACSRSHSRGHGESQLTLD